MTAKKIGTVTDGVKAQLTVRRLKAAIRLIHERSWVAGDDREGAKNATEMWEIADAARNKENF